MQLNCVAFQALCAISKVSAARLVMPSCSLSRMLMHLAQKCKILQLNSRYVPCNVGAFAQGRNLRLLKALQA